MTMRYDELCAQVTATIVDTIETGRASSWRAPWHHNGETDLFSPRNAATGRPYTGGNILLLALDSLEAGYDSNIWATYKQWQHLGGQVRRDEHGTRCVKWIAKTTGTNGSADDDNVRQLLIPRLFTVFNVSQVDDYHPAAITSSDSPDPIPRVEAFIAATGANIDYGFNTAKYRPLVDRIQVPGIDQYDEVEDHYATVLHELVHWTGHPGRLARTFGQRFGDDAYAAEELVAELGAAFATAQLGIANDPRPDHAAYIEHWLGILDSDAKALFAVAAKAQAAVDHLTIYSETSVA